MIIGPWEWDDKHLLSFRGVKWKKKKKKRDARACVCELRGRGRREGKSYKSLYISVGAGHISQRRRRHTALSDTLRSITPKSVFYKLYWFLKKGSRSGFTLSRLLGRGGVMDPIVEVVALVLGFVGWVMLGVCLPNRYWRTSTVDGNVITTSTIYENLWMSCATDSTGVHNCREFPSLLALSGRSTKKNPEI